MNDEKMMRFEVTTIGNCFLHGFETMNEAFDYANSLDIKTKVYDSRFGCTYEVSGHKWKRKW